MLRYDVRSIYLAWALLLGGAVTLATRCCEQFCSYLRFFSSGRGVGAGAGELPTCSIFGLVVGLVGASFCLTTIRKIILLNNSDKNIRSIYRRVTETLMLACTCALSRHGDIHTGTQTHGYSLSEYTVHVFFYATYDMTLSTWQKYTKRVSTTSIPTVGALATTPLYFIVGMHTQKQQNRNIDHVHDKKRKKLWCERE